MDVMGLEYQEYIQINDPLENFMMNVLRVWDLNIRVTHEPFIIDTSLGETMPDFLIDPNGHGGYPIILELTRERASDMSNRKERQREKLELFLLESPDPYELLILYMEHFSSSDTIHSVLEIIAWLAQGDIETDDAQEYADDLADNITLASRARLSHDYWVDLFHETMQE